MKICSNCDSFEKFDPQAVVNELSKSVQTHRQPGVRKEKSNQTHQLDADSVSNSSDYNELYEREEYVNMTLTVTVNLTVKLNHAVIETHNSDNTCKYI